jgi:hypothetical protein
MEGYAVRVLFTTMMAVQDRDHVVRATMFGLARLANMPVEDVRSALKVLEEPDKIRVEDQEHEGRRIRRVEDGWLILNGDKYQKEMVKLFRRAKNAEAMRRSREALKNAKGKPLGGEVTHQTILDREGKEAADDYTDKVVE